MKVLIIGGGGREHALAWKISQSPKVEKIYCAPGNAGIAELAECIDLHDNVEELVKFAQRENIDLTVVGPEKLLAAGIVDEFTNAGLRIFGPTKAAAEIESSKVFSKELMEKYDIPTPVFDIFDNAEAALKYIDENGAPCVIKADGLAAGKGVIVARNKTAAKEAVRNIMEDKAFGTAGNKIVIEDFVEGQEVSILAFVDGTTVVPMVSAQDHKPLLDEDKGPNTGGMGAYSPTSLYTDEIKALVEEKILQPVVKAMADEGRSYSGVLYAGLMIDEEGEVSVLEFNARFGDPETQAVLLRLDSDLVEIMESVIDGRLAEQEIKWKEEGAAVVVIASGGYPGDYVKGIPIKGLEKQQDKENVFVFHAGTKKDKDQVVTSGGRVLGVAALAEDVIVATLNAYEMVDCIEFKNMYYRKDISHYEFEKYVFN